jgi:hypothetical protein
MAYASWKAQQGDVSGSRPVHAGRRRLSGRAVQERPVE